jgi:uncharacterized protein
LSLAAMATAVGFLSFLPTDYRGLSDLGLVAGVGMLIAFMTSITVLSALIAGFKPPAEPRRRGFAVLEPIDGFMLRHRLPIVFLPARATLVLVMARRGGPPRLGRPRT